MSCLEKQLLIRRIRLPIYIIYEIYDFCFLTFNQREKKREKKNILLKELLNDCTFKYTDNDYDVRFKKGKMSKNCWPLTFRTCKTCGQISKMGYTTKNEPVHSTCICYFNFMGYKDPNKEYGYIIPKTDAGYTFRKKV